MKKFLRHLTAITLLIIPFTVFSQTSTADLLAQKWKYIGVEEFGVVHAPDSTMKNDWVSFKSDGTFEWAKSGKTVSGTYKLNEAAKIVSFTDSKTKKTLTYNLKNITATDLTLEFQTPDLVRTKYRYQAVKE